MTDLRERLAEALRGEIKTTWTDGSWFVSVGEMPAAALRVFAEWLRERADEDPNEGTPNTLRQMADEITPKDDARD